MERARLEGQDRPERVFEGERDFTRRQLGHRERRLAERSAGELHRRADGEGFDAERPALEPDRDLGGLPGDDVCLRAEVGPPGGAGDDGIGPGGQGGEVVLGGAVLVALERGGRGFAGGREARRLDRRAGAVGLHGQSSGRLGDDRRLLGFLLLRCLAAPAGAGEKQGGEGQDDGGILAPAQPRQRMAFFGFHEVAARGPLLSSGPARGNEFFTEIASSPGLSAPRGSRPAKLPGDCADRP